MYYDRTTQQKYIKRALLSITTTIVVIILTIIVLRIIGSTKQISTNQPVATAIGTSRPTTVEPLNLVESEDQTETLYRIISVTDGDTIRIDYNGVSTPVRLIGIDTPETVDSRTNVECFGPEATEYLKTMLTGKSVKIEADPTQDDYDAYDRMLRYVYLDNKDVGLKLITSGYASEYTYDLPYKKQSEYKAAETIAKQSKKGQWANDMCNNTDDNTAEQPKSQISQENTTVQCLIKGNISWSGEKIYHMPGQKYYNSTKINTADGERWFCTEREAISAGWRKSKV